MLFFCVFGMRKCYSPACCAESAFFQKAKYFGPKKINLGISKASKQILSKGDMYYKHMQFQLSKVFSAKLVIFLWFTKNFVKKLSHFFKNSCDLIYALNLYVTVFFQPNYTPKQIKTMNSFENEKFRPHEFFEKGHLFFYT